MTDEEVDRVIGGIGIRRVLSRVVFIFRQAVADPRYTNNPAAARVRALVESALLVGDGECMKEEET